MALLPFFTPYMKPVHLKMREQHGVLTLDKQAFGLQELAEAELHRSDRSLKSSNVQVL